MKKNKRDSELGKKLTEMFLASNIEAQENPFIWWMTIETKEIDDPFVPITKKHRPQARNLKEALEKECPNLHVVAGLDIDWDSDVDVWMMYVIPPTKDRALTFEEGETLTRLGITHGGCCGMVEMDEIATILARIGGFMDN